MRSDMNGVRHKIRAQKHGVVYVAAALFVGITLLPASSVYASSNHNSRKNTVTTKDWVCKYVTKPGGEERLKRGNDGLVWVDTHATEGTWFKDGQYKSYVVLADAPHSARPSVSNCPGGEVRGDRDECPPTEDKNQPKDDAKDCPPKEEKPAEDKKDCPPKEVVVMPVSVVMPSVEVVCGANNDTVIMPTIEHVTYTQTGWVDGKNTVTATADAGYYIDGTQKDAEKSWTLTDENTSCGQVLGDTTTTPTVTPVVTTAVLEDTGATIAPISVMGTVLIGIAALVFMSGARRQKLQEAINAIAL